MDATTRGRLQAALKRESRSVMVYTAEAFPWTAARDSASTDKLSACIQAEVAAVTALGRFLVRNRVPLPYLGSYPASFTTINFIALDWLLPRLVAFEKTSLEELKQDLAAVTDPAAREPLERLAAVKKDNLAALESLLAEHTVPSAS